MKHIIGACPICQREMVVQKLYCDNCDITVKGNFVMCKFCSLNKEQKIFIETFIKCRGNIKDVEKDLGISYPTVRSRLDDVILALGYKLKDSKEDDQRKEVLDMLERGEIKHEEAIKLLKENKMEG